MNIFDKLKAGVVTESATEMQALAAALGRSLAADTTLALHGDLGVGKTTFVQGLATGLGVTAHVTSPTFNVFTLYRGGVRTLIHLDAYRLERAAEIEALMLEDFLVTPYCLAVEWPEKIAEWLPAQLYRLRLEIAAPGKHRVQLVAAPSA